MATLILHRLKCEDPDDWTGDDAEIRVNQPKDRAVWRKPMKAGQTRSLGDIQVKFNGQVTVELREKESVFGDDIIGQQTIVTKDPPNQVARIGPTKVEFRTRKARYGLWYSLVVGGPTIPSTKARDPKKPPATPKPTSQAKTPAKAKGVAGAGAGAAKIACQLGALIVKVVDEKNKPIGNATITVHGLSGPVRTGANGMHSFARVPAKRYMVEAYKHGYFPAPSTRSVQVKAGSPTHVTLRLGNFKLVKVTPDKDCRWYVNLDQNDKYHHGPQVTVRAQVHPKVAGVSVRFLLLSFLENATTRRGGGQAGLTKHTSLTDANGIAETKLKLSHYGGEKFQVVASLARKSSANKASGTIVVWRKLYYEITEMLCKDKRRRYELPDSALALTKQSLADVYIEFKPDNKLKNFGRQHGWHLGERYKNNKISKAYPMLRGWADPYRSKHQIPWKVHFAVAGTMVDKKEKKITRTVSPTSTIIPGYSFDPWGPAKSDWLGRAEYSVSTARPDWKPLPAAAVDIDRSQPRARLKVDMQKVAPGRNVLYDVRIRHFVASTGTIGVQSGHHIFIFRGTIEDWQKQTAAMINTLGRVCAHEIGHALGLNTPAQSWHDPKHTDHCRTPNCLMWWTSGPTGGLKFLGANNKNNCRSFVLGKDMSRAVMQKDNKWK